jgi:hypothetical protein
MLHDNVVQLNQCLYWSLFTSSNIILTSYARMPRRGCAAWHTLRPGRSIGFAPLRSGWAGTTKLIVSRTAKYGPLRRRFLCSARGRAFVRSARERSDMGRGPSVHAQYFFCTVWYFVLRFCFQIFFSLSRFLRFSSVCLAVFWTFSNFQKLFEEFW